MLPDCAIAQFGRKFRLFLFLHTTVTKEHNERNK